MAEYCAGDCGYESAVRKMIGGVLMSGLGKGRVRAREEMVGGILFVDVYEYEIYDGWIMRGMGIESFQKKGGWRDMG